MTDPVTGNCIELIQLLSGSIDSKGVLTMRDDLAESLSSSYGDLERQVKLNPSRGGGKPSAVLKGMQQRVHSVLCLSVFSSNSPTLRYFSLRPYDSLKDLQLDMCPPSTVHGLYDLHHRLESLVITNSGITNLYKVLAPIDIKILQQLSPLIFPESVYTVPLHYTWSKLVTLKLSNCGLTRIDGSMHLFPAVRTLDLSHNSIIHVTHLQDCIELRNLNLSFNRIRVLSNLERVLGRITNLNVAYNEIQSLDGVDKVYSLERLNAMSNLVDDCAEVQHLCKLPCLESVTLQENPIADKPNYRLRVFREFIKDGTVLSKGRSFPTLDGHGMSKKDLRTLRRVMFRTAEASADSQAEFSHAGERYQRSDELAGEEDDLGAVDFGRDDYGDGGDDDDDSSLGEIDAGMFFNSSSRAVSRAGPAGLGSGSGDIERSPSTSIESRSISVNGGKMRAKSVAGGGLLKQSIGSISSVNSKTGVASPRSSSTQQQQPPNMNLWLQATSLGGVGGGRASMLSINGTGISRGYVMRRLKTTANSRPARKRRVASIEPTAAVNPPPARSSRSAASAQKKSSSPSAAGETAAAAAAGTAKDTEQYPSLEEVDKELQAKRIMVRSRKLTMMSAERERQRLWRASLENTSASAAVAAAAVANTSPIPVNGAASTVSASVDSRVKGGDSIPSPGSSDTAAEIAAPPPPPPQPPGSNLDCTPVPSKHVKSIPLSPGRVARGAAGLDGAAVETRSFSNNLSPPSSPTRGGGGSLSNGKDSSVEAVSGGSPGTGSGGAGSGGGGRKTTSLLTAQISRSKMALAADLDREGSESPPPPASTMDDLVRTRNDALISQPYAQHQHQQHHSQMQQMCGGGSDGAMSDTQSVGSMSGSQQLQPQPRSMSHSLNSQQIMDALMSAEDEIRGAATASTTGVDSVASSLRSESYTQQQHHFPHQPHLSRNNSSMSNSSRHSRGNGVAGSGTASIAGSESAAVCGSPGAFAAAITASQSERSAAEMGCTTTSAGIAGVDATVVSDGSDSDQEGDVVEVLASAAGSAAAKQGSALCPPPLQDPKLVAAGGAGVGAGNSPRGSESLVYHLSEDSNSPLDSGNTSLFNPSRAHSDLFVYTGDTDYRNLTVHDNIELYFKEQVFGPNRPSGKRPYLKYASGVISAAQTGSLDDLQELSAGIADFVVAPSKEEESFAALFYEKVRDISQRPQQQQFQNAAGFGGSGAARSALLARRASEQAAGDQTQNQQYTSLSGGDDSKASSSPSPTNKKGSSPSRVQKQQSKRGKADSKSAAGKSTGSEASDDASKEEYFYVVQTDQSIYIVQWENFDPRQLFSDAPVFSVKAAHPLYALCECTIFFGFQRCILGFADEHHYSHALSRYGHDSSSGLMLQEPVAYSYMFLTRDRNRSYPIITNIPKAANARRSELKSSALRMVKIENLDLQLIEKVTQYVLNLGLDHDILHYQMAFQVWRKQPHLKAARSIVLTQSLVLLCRENLSIGQVELEVLDKANLTEIYKIFSEDNPLYVTFVIKPSKILSKTRKWRLCTDSRATTAKLQEECRRACAECGNLDV